MKDSDVIVLVQGNKPIVKRTTFTECFRKLSPHSGDIVVFKLNQWCEDAVGQLREAQKLLPEGIVFVCLSPGETVELLPEEAMRKHGWERVKP